MADLPLLLDIQATQSVDHGDRGIARYVIDHARAMAAAHQRVMRLYLNPLLPFPGRLPMDMLDTSALRWNTAGDVNAIVRRGPAIYHLMSPFELDPPTSTVIPPHIIEAGIPIVATLYDLIPLVFPERYLANPEIARRYRTRLESLRQVDLLLAISEHTRKDAIRLLEIDEDKVVTIGGGTSPLFVPPSPHADPLKSLQRMLPSLHGPFILSVVGADDRKNVEALLTAYSRLPAQVQAAYQLVLTCHLPPYFEESWRNHALACGIEPDRLILTGYIGDDVLHRLYQAARLFVFPSLYEGFGLPVAEAIACGCPAITSNSSSLPEILDFPEATFSPHDPDEMAAVMERALDDERFRAVLLKTAHQRARVHTWSAVAHRTLDALSRFGSPRAPRVEVRGRRTRMALVTPLPPTRSGIAGYSAAVIEELEKVAVVDVLVPGGYGERSPTAKGSTYPVSALGPILSPAAYDAVVYVMGNSEHHHDTYEAALRHPGIVWFHDVRLGGLYFTYGQERIGDAQRFLAGKLLSQYADRVPEEVVGAWTGEAQMRYGLGLTQELTRASRAVCVNSDFARRLLLLDQGPDGVVSDISILPFAIQSPRGVRASRPESPVIASFGIVDPVKGTHLLIDAFAGVHARRPDARLVFVGPVWSEFELQMREHAASLDLTDSLEMTGHVNDHDYHAWLGKATCAVQWRTRTNGESSAALADAFGAGLPTVTNMPRSSTGCGEGSAVFLDAWSSARDIADACVMLIDDEQRWEDLSLAGLSAGRAHRVDATAAALLDVVHHVASSPDYRGSLLH